jgi:DNA-directed RNA polymerase specialized sigma24 family protein
MDIEATLVEIDPLLRVIARERVGSQSWMLDDAIQEARIRAWTRLTEGHSIGIAVHAAKQAVIDVVTGKRMTGSKQAGVPITRTVPLTLNGPSGEEFVVEPEDASATAAYDAVEQGAEGSLEAALALLDDGQRSAVLGAMDGLTRREIAARDGVSHQAVTKRLRAAGRKLSYIAA